MSSDDIVEDSDDGFASSHDDGDGVGELEMANMPSNRGGRGQNGQQQTPIAVSGVADAIEGEEPTGMFLDHDVDASEGGAERWDTEEEAANFGETFPPIVGGPKPWWILLPTQTLSKIWGVYLLIPLLYVATITPFRLFFVQSSAASDSGWLAVEWIVTASFAVDIVLNFLTGFENENGDIVVYWRDIAMRYLKSWFVVDLIATFPIDLLLPASNDTAASSANELARLTRLPRALRIIRLIRLARLLRLPHLHEYVARLENASVLHPAVGRIVVLFFWLVLLLSFLGGVFHFVGTLEEEAGRPSWLYETCPANTCIGDLDLGGRYLWSVYWALTTITTTGYGDIIPASTAEVGVSVFVQLLGILFGAFIAASLLSVLTHADALRAALQEKERRLTAFMRTARLPRNLRNVVTRQFKQAAQLDAARASETSIAREVLSLLSPSVRESVILHSNRRVLSLLPILNKENASTRAAVVRHLTRLAASPGDLVVAEGTLARSMVFVARGRVSIWRNGLRIVECANGSMFGDVDVLFSSTRLFSARAETHCELYALNRNDLARIIAEHSSFGENLKALSLGRLRRLEQKVGHDIVPHDTLMRLRKMRVGVARVMPWVDSFVDSNSQNQHHPTAAAPSSHSQALPPDVLPLDGVAASTGIARESDEDALFKDDTIRSALPTPQGGVTSDDDGFLARAAAAAIALDGNDAHKNPSDD